jgi:hypothetical protein
MLLRTLIAAATSMALGATTPAPARASAILAQHFSSQEEFANYLAKQGLDAGADMRMMVQGRLGDSRIGGAWEVGLFGAEDTAAAKPGATAQLNWAKEQSETSWVPFSLSRFGETLAFTLGGATTVLTLPKGEAISALAFTAIAGPKDSRAILRDLVLDGKALDSAEVRADSGSQDTSLVQGLDGDFTLTGEARLRWDEKSMPKDLASVRVQIAGYALTSEFMVPPGNPAQIAAPPSPAAIPEPGSAMVLLAASLGLIGHRHLRRRGAGQD